MLPSPRSRKSESLDRRAPGVIRDVIEVVVVFDGGTKDVNATDDDIVDTAVTTEKTPSCRFFIV